MEACKWSNGLQTEAHAEEGDESRLYYGTRPLKTLASFESGGFGAFELLCRLDFWPLVRSACTLSIVLSTRCILQAQQKKGPLPTDYFCARTRVMPRARSTLQTCPWKVFRRIRMYRIAF